MLRQSSSRNQRNRVLRVKHVLQMSLLVAVCFWLLYQLKHSYDEKKASVDANSETSSNLEEEQHRFVKLGRKDLPDNEEANLDEEREKEQEAVKQVMEEEEIGEGEQVRGNERDDEEREDEGEDADGRGRGEASRVAREDRELEYEDDKSEENEEKMESGDENEEEKFVGDDGNDGDVGSTIDDDTNFADGEGEGDVYGDGDSSLKKTVPDDNASTNGVGSNHNESIVGLDGKEGSLDDHHRHQIAASDGDTDNIVPLQNQTFNLESMEEEKHVSVKREIDEENKPTPNNSSFTLEQEDFGENSTVPVAENDVGDVDVNKLVADAHLDLSTLPVIQGEVGKDAEDAAE